MQLDYLDDPEFQDLIREYLDYLLESLPNLKEDFSNRNFSKIQKFGHNLKGSGGGYGFDDMTQLGRKMQLAANNRVASDLELLIRQFEDLLDKKRKEYFR